MFVQMTANDKKIQPSIVNFYSHYSFSCVFEFLEEIKHLNLLTVALKHFVNHEVFYFIHFGFSEPCIFG